MKNPVQFTETQQFDFDQSVFAATAHLKAAKAAIDAEYGEGYAAANPALVGAFMQAAAADFQSMWIGQRLEALEGAVQDIAAGLPVDDQGLLQVVVYRAG